MSAARDFLAAVQQRADAATDGHWVSASDIEGEPGVEVYKRGVSLRHEMDYALSGSGRKQGALDAEFIAASRTDVPRLVAALTAALELHKPVYYDGEWCSTCIDPDTVDLDEATAGAVSYPCPTVRAITDALTPKENDS